MAKPTASASSGWRRISASSGNVSFYNRFVEFEELKAFLGVGRHLRHALSQRRAKHLRHAGLRFRQRQGGDLHAVLARAGIARRQSRRARAIQRHASDGEGGARPAQRRHKAQRHAQARLPDRPRNDLEQDRRATTWSRLRKRAAARPAFPAGRLGVRTLADESLELPAVSHRSPDAPVRLDRHSSARDLFLPRFSPWLLHRRQCARADPHRVAGKPGTGAQRISLAWAKFMPARCSTRSIPTQNGSAISWASIATGWSRSAREDSHGRALWALGTCVGRSKRRDLQAWAAQLFDRALPSILDTTSPRAWAYDAPRHLRISSAASTATASPHRHAIP